MNLLKDVMPKILAQALITLREECVMPRLVNTDYSQNASERGSVIHIPIPSKIKAQDVVPGPYSQTEDNLQINTAKIVLNNWKEAPFALTDKDIGEVMNGVANMQVVESARAISNAINESLFALYTGVYNFVGTAGTTPFASSATLATQARKKLQTDLAPRFDRRLVLDVDAEANALDLQAFRSVQESGDSNVLTEGMLGRKYGFDWYSDQLMPNHVSGDILPKDASTITTVGNASSTVTADASDPEYHNPITTYSVDLENVTSGGVKKGDVFKIAGDDRTYVVTGNATSSSGNITVSFSPAPSFEWGAGRAVEFIDSHAVNLAFHRDAIGLAVRPLANQDQFMEEIGGAEVMTMVDPQTGLPLRLEVRREYKRLRYSLDCLWGCGLVRPENAVRVLG